MLTGRTDLAVETVGDLTQADGIGHFEREEEGVAVTEVEIQTAAASERLGREMGRYVTVDLGPIHRRETAAFRRSAHVLAKEIAKLLPHGGTVLVVGLGNRSMTPDRLGPLCCDHILVTHHLVEKEPSHFGGFRSVATLAPGVLGTTGVESAQVAAAVAGKVKPACVIAIDALAASDMERLCATVQLTDTGISPGSGVGNHRDGITEETLGVPVIALGMPTVAEAHGGRFVTPRDIDVQVAQCAKLVACAINLALQPGLTMEDLEALTE